MLAKYALFFVLFASFTKAMRLNKRRGNQVAMTENNRTISPGDLLNARSDVEATALIMADFDIATEHASTFKLNPDFDLYAGEFEWYAKKAYFRAYTWEALTIWRIHQSYLMRPLGTVWEDDKLDQKCIVETLTAARYIDYFTGVDRESAEQSRKRGFEDERTGAAAVGTLYRMIQDLVERRERFVVKASHGANGNAVHAYCNPESRDYNAQDAFNNAIAAYHSEVEKSENWQIQMVLPGVVIQECYDSVKTDFGRPLEFKILTQWGRVVGATLETRPKEFWVTREGKVWQWQTDQTADGLISKTYGKGKVADERIDPATMQHILVSLKSQWHTMRDLAEDIARALGNDELRVDFFFGNPSGPRLNEITYMGGAARYPRAVQAKLASVLIGGYASRRPCHAAGGSLDPNCRAVDLPDVCHHYDPDEKGEMPGPDESRSSWLRFQALVKAGVNFGQGR